MTVREQSFVPVEADLLGNRRAGSPEGFSASSPNVPQMPGLRGIGAEGVRGLAALRGSLEAGVDVAGLTGLVVGASNRLHAELDRYGIAADVHDGRGVALVSVWRDLVVWVEPGSEGLRYRWWTGRRSVRTGRYVYTGFPAHAVEVAARRIATRYAELRRTHPMSDVIAETLSLPALERREAGR